MPEPVKLSRERWDSLTRGGHPNYERVVVLIDNAGTPQMTKRAIVRETLEFDGIIFLPAEYVPGGTERVARVQKLSAAPCA